MGYKAYLTKCRNCGGTTGKAYALAHEGQCKSCVTGIDQTKYYRCGDCGQMSLTKYQRDHGYHCDTCTHNVETTGGIYGY
jgi:DNA-directed RNA polymerase subunit RPC12/RpoP